MDVKIYNNFSVPDNNNVHHTGNNNINDTVETALKAETKKIPEKVMMDLKDVQNFLYMLIGSDIKVESNNNSSGTTINAIA